MTTTRKLGLGALLHALAVGTLLTTASCEDWIYDNADCGTFKVKFVYDRNMKYVDAFATSVSSVGLYAYDDNGELAYSTYVSGARLAAADFSIPLDLPEGHYTLVAWCEDGDRESYSYSAPVENVTRAGNRLTDMTCSIDFDRDREEGNVIDHDLNALFHGMAEMEVSATPGEHVTTIYLTKDTHNVRVLLEKIDGEPLYPEDFDIKIIDDNGVLAYDNSVVGGEFLNYRPWYKDSYTSRDTETPTALYAEMTIGRMMSDHNARLVVNRADNGENIINLPLYRYALLVKGFYNSTMTDQEYLDRQDDFTFTFFLDSDMRWLDASIIINSWTVVVREKELE
jgi:hypothetical protein